MQENPPNPNAALDASAENETTTASGVKIDKPGYTVEKRTFGGGDKSVFNGLEWYCLQFKTVADATAHFESLNTGKGAEITLALINQSINGRLATKAKNTVADLANKETTGEVTVEDVNKIKANNPCVFSVEDAEKFIPGAKDVESEAGYRRELARLAKEAKEAKDAGNVELKNSLVEEYKKTRMEMDAFIAAKLDKAIDL